MSISLRDSGIIPCSCGILKMLSACRQERIEDKKDMESRLTGGHSMSFLTSALFEGKG